MGNLIIETPYSEITATVELFDRLGIGRDDLKRFRKSSSRVKTAVAKLIKGQGAGTNIIDCDADPFTPRHLKVIEHMKGGQLNFDPSQVEFYLSEVQKNDKGIVGKKLRTELKDKPVLNANVLDYLLANPDLIPEEWKVDESGNSRYIFFWGTVYRNSDFNFCVRFLCWGAARWRWGSFWLGSYWESDSPAALLAG